MYKATKREWLYILLGLILIWSFGFVEAFAQARQTVVRVGPEQDYQGIQQAISGTSHIRHVMLVVSPGVYREKIFITRNNLSLVGSSPEDTIIEFPILRENWRRKHAGDWGAAVVNINGTDIALINLTVRNLYGTKQGTDKHQFAVRGGELSDRIIFHNCHMISAGADTVSLWNKRGRYYHSKCYFEGYTDMVCPRGTALIEDSTFYNNKQSATLWHDGELDANLKLVVNRSHFDGVEGFWLGRHHYDAQFYLLNSRFSKTMADKPIFKKRYEDKRRDRPNRFGERYFFEGNVDQNKYAWTHSNFSISDLSLETEAKLEAWVFEGKWNPSQVISSLLKQTQNIQKNVQ